MINSHYKILMLVLVVFVFTTGCTGSLGAQQSVQPQLAEMKSICELATMECYYRNVAKFDHENSSGILFWKKDKKFWVEYSGIVKMGIDASLLSLEIVDKEVTVTIPEAKVLDYKVDAESLKLDNFIVAKDSDAPTGEDEILAFAKAQEYMKLTASNDSALLASAQQRAQSLIEDYINNIGEVVGKNYTIKWNYVQSTVPEETKEGN